ncbi:TPMT family [Trinorchestia longiramus]|nr:TPMT family [Trinorchestia longiramus]
MASTEKVAESEDYTIADWEKIWAEYGKEKRPPRKVSEPLLRHWQKLVTEEPSKIFLPLCGQSSDLRWLYDKGHSVVGLDGVASALEAIVLQNDDLGFSKATTVGGTIVYKSSDGRFELHCVDVLEPFVRSLGPFDAVYDYGAYTAIMPSVRQQYVDTVLATLHPRYRYMVEFCHDVSEGCEGPCVISFMTMKKEFGKGKKLEFLETMDCSEEWGVEAFFSTIALVTPASSSEH